VEILPGALKHGVSPEAITHAVDHALTTSDAGEEPLRVLVIGPDLAGNLLEIIAIIRDQDLLVIHAMPMRPKYRHLLP
jgi:hypothetical protein